VIVLDTSVLIDSLTGPKRASAALRKVIDQGERLLVPCIVLYEWLRGPRLPAELALQQALFPREATLPFGWEESVIAAQFYRTVRRARGREIDLAIAAQALAWDADLWTLHNRDLRDIPGLRLFQPPV
jgi:predicted nucleic acid-binding protein